MVHAHEMEYRGLHIVDVNGSFRDVEAEFVGRADCVSRAYAMTDEHKRIPWMGCGRNECLLNTRGNFECWLAMQSRRGDAAVLTCLSCRYTILQIGELCRGRPGFSIKGAVWWISRLGTATI